MTMNQEGLSAAVIRLLRPFWATAAFATAMGTLSGLATAWLLATINHALYAEEEITAALMWSFAGLVMLTLAGEVVSDLGNSWIGQQIIANLRKELVTRVVVAPIDQIERYKAHRLLSVLGQDVDTISAFSYGFSALAIALAVTLGCVAYLLFLSPLLFVIVSIAIGAGIAVNRAARTHGAAYYDAARAAQDDLYRHYRSITEGAKELRINRQRRRRVHDEQLADAIHRIRDMKVMAFRIFMSANAVDSALFFAVIGVIVGWQSWFGIDRTVVSGFVLVLLYVRGPLSQLTGAYGAFVNAQVSFRRLAQLSADFANPEPHLAEATGLAVPDPASLPAVQTLELRGAGYSFPAAQGTEPFALGPIDLTVRGGEIVMIVGENGCGKTTLVKLLLGLYAPQQGELLFNGAPVTAETRDEYRQLFSAIHFDFHLFDDIVAPGGIVPEAVQAYLRKLEIAHKATVENGRFTTTDLSAGQRKRLALIQLYLEARPVIVTDEWAAEQDPTFRRIFYTELLPELRAQGRTLIVISHDDRYFDVADRVVRMEKGQIIEIIENPGIAYSRGHGGMLQPRRVASAIPGALS